MSVTRDFTDRLTWEEKAQVNPLWAVMSVNEFSGVAADPAEWTPDQLALFFAKGEALFDIFLRPPLARTRVAPADGFVVEYGSGMGRILRAVSQAGYRAAGVDISATMLEHSRRLVPEVAELHHLGADGAIGIADRVADYVYSYAVLQHIPQLSHVRRAVLEMCRILKPGGLLRLQFQPGSMPFGAAPYGTTRALNFERRSLTFRWVDPHTRWTLPEWVPRLPLVRLRGHNHWSGVPLRWERMQQFLREGGVRLLSLERDPAAEWNSVWLLGKKDLGR